MWAWVGKLQYIFCTVQLVKSQKVECLKTSFAKFTEYVDENVYSNMFKYAEQYTEIICNNSIIFYIIMPQLSDLSNVKKVKIFWLVLLPSPLVEEMNLNVLETGVISDTLNLSMSLRHKAGVIGTYAILVF